MISPEVEFIFPFTPPVTSTSPDIVFTFPVTPSVISIFPERVDTLPETFLAVIHPETVLIPPDFIFP